MDPSYTIGSAHPADLFELPAIELAAASLFADHGVSAEVLSDSTSPDDFREALEEGLLWVARSIDGHPVGFAHVDLISGNPHLEEVDVHPSHGRRGVGRALVEAVCRWARESGHASITLTTFRDIPWNAPFYASAGFRILEEDEVPEELVREEAGRGLDPKRRVVMVRALGPRRC